MSLISFRNFLAPFSSKFQIGLLLVLAFLAFVIRYQSNVEGTESPAAGTAAKAQRVVSLEEADLLNAMTQPSALGSGSKRKPATDTMLDDALAGSRGSGQSPAGAGQPPQQRGGGGSLNDIRKSMGLE